MDFYKRPTGDYRNNFKKGRFYRAPFPLFRRETVIARPLHDGDFSSSDKIPADLYTRGSSTLTNPFNHDPFNKLKLKSDEEFAVMKIKKRPGILLNNPSEEDDRAYLAPVFTIKDYHKERINIEKIKKENDSNDYLYLPPSSEHNIKESLVFLFKRMRIFNHKLEPMPKELSREALEMIDEKIFYDLDMFDYDSSNSSEPI